MKVNVDEELVRFIRENAPDGGFQPFAYYDKHLDCIRVQIKDCSFTESRLSSIFTILQANHAEITPEYVGFNIKGVRYLFRSIGLPDSGVITLAQIIDAIVKIYPDGVVKRIRETFGHLLEPLEVDLNFAEAA